jgi:hypothetical protein
MSLDVTPLFAEYEAGNRGPDPANPTLRRQPDYGIAATLAGSVLDVVLTFRTGSAYCCCQWGCHLELDDGERWDGLRRRLHAAGIESPPRMELRLTCEVESGALFFDFDRPDPTRRGRYAFAPAAGMRYLATATEAVPSQ